MLVLTWAACQAGASQPRQCACTTSTSAAAAASATDGRGSWRATSAKAPIRKPHGFSAAADSSDLRR